MNNKENAVQVSYHVHESVLRDYAQGGKNESLAKTWLRKDTVDAWRHERMYMLLDPVLKAYPNSMWLTVGDGRYGNDAHYIQNRGQKALPTNISDVLLKEAKSIGYIDDYRKENAEALSFSDREFDFVFCKESYHHFPRPMIALYEMLRVARKGVVLIEPNDQWTASPTLLQVLLRKLRLAWWSKGRGIRNILRERSITHHAYEEGGNYVYSISEREIEKVALGLNLGAVAFKGLNDYYVKGVEHEKATIESKLFKKVRLKIACNNLQTKLRLKPYGLLCAMIFKNEITTTAIDDLRASGYQIIFLPRTAFVSSHH